MEFEQFIKNIMIYLYIKKYQVFSIGSIALVDCDLHSHPNIKNWISYVYVFPEFRGQGVSTKLLDFIINKYNDKFTLTLWCKHTLNGLYEKNGFIITETLPSIYIMQKPKV
jgi:GNAT superfamily N-acetyltransferase